jgi:hypothetical protein
MNHRLIYPTDEVSLRDVVRAALAECGAEHVSVVTGSGSQVVRVLESCADRVEEAAGLREGAAPQPPQDPPPPPVGSGETAPGPEGTDSNESGPGAPTPTANKKTATPDTDKTGRPAGRAAGKTAAKKTAARGTRSKEDEK